MKTILSISAAVLLSACTISAMMIDGQQMSIDDAIMKAGSNGSMSGMFEIMQGKDEAGNDMVMVELDMLYKMDTYMEMRKDMTMPGEEPSAQSGGRAKRKAIRQTSYRWPNNRVPYEISGTFSSNDRALVMSAIADYHRYTCIRFAPRSGADRNYVVFQNGGGCSSYVGTIGGRQPISLAPGCRYKGIIIHEMGHAIGFQHEQTRPDRDSRVVINNQNIQSGVAYNFMKYSDSQVNNYDIAYDYTSVMHYSQYAFSRNGRPTITARYTSYQNAMGNREGLSFKDIAMANAMYSCSARCGSVRCPTGAFVDQNCRCMCDSGVRGSPVKVCGGAAVTTPAPTRATTRSPINRCEDKNQYCPRWASAGYCTGTYQTYMSSNCPFSCDTCTMTTTTTTTMATPPIANCEDESQYCSYWASRGECTRNPSYMNRNCKRSCNTCDGTSQDCRDMNDGCPSWKSYCDVEAYKDYLSRNCKRSCNICTSLDVTAKPATTTTTAPETDCVDTQGGSYCRRNEWRCSNPAVRNRCAKTCHTCSV